MKRIVAVTLALLLLVAALPMTVAADSAVELTLDERVTVSAGGEVEVLCTYTAEEDGRYLFTSDEGWVDSYVKQMNADGETFGEPDDGDGDDTAFWLIVDMEAGKTYSFLVGVHDEETWDFPVQLFRAFEPTGVELFGGREEITMSFLEDRYLDDFLLPADVLVLPDKVEFTVGDESVAYLSEDSYMLSAMSVGQTTLTVTVNDTLTDTVTVNVVEPLVWDGVGTAPVILSENRPIRTYAFTVENDGWYEILSEGEYDSVLTIYYEADGTFWYYGYSDDEYGYNFGYTDYFEAGVTYYLVISTYDELKGAFTFPVTVREAEEEEELPETGIGFYEDSITVTLGERFFPDGWLGTSEDMADITSADESIVQADLMEGCVATGLGETTLTITATSGASDTMTVTVVAPATLTLGEKTEVEISQSWETKFFTFTPETDGTYVFRSFSKADPLVTVFDSEGNQIGSDDDSMTGLNFFLEVELTGGETYQVQVSNYQADTFEFVVVKGEPATRVTLEPNEDAWVKKDGKTYYTYVGTRLYETILFGDELGALEEGYEITVEDETLLVYSEEERGLQAAATGTTTMTVKTGNGLTDTITIVVVDYVPGDITMDGYITEADKKALAAYLKDAASAGEQWFLLDCNEDGVVDEDDLEMMTELAPVPFLWGDVDGDGSITSTDARLTLQYYAGKITEADLNIDLADVDGDGEITSTDARLILQKYAGKIDGFPVDEL